MTDSTRAAATAVSEPSTTTDRALTWLREEFPDWTVDVDTTATWEGDMLPLWVARRDGHHPQAALSAAKLHSRLSDYLHRETRRRSWSN